MPRQLAVSIIVVALSVAATARADSSFPNAHSSPYDWAFVGLDYARQEKAEQLKRYCDKIHALASRAREDEAVNKFFELNLKCSEVARSGSPPQEFIKRTEEFRKSFNEYYIEHWLAFYDMLFIDRQGRVIYSIRRGSNFERSMFEGEFAETPLSQCLRTDPREEMFIDFHYYDASNEPAAFFVEPVHVAGEHQGWIVLQCAINKINSLFAGTEQLGETGETFLVNRSGLMLTESNFEGDSTILAKKLSNENIEAKFRERQGHRTVTDYRGFTALTSFEVVEFLGTQWLVVAKLDEAQVTTDHFMQHRNYYGDKIIDNLAGLTVGEGRDAFSETDRTVIRVDMDEFVKANHAERLKTLGVSTCTAVIATYPGKFGYLAHISPLDKMYGSADTNLLGHITKKIKTYDIYKYERRRVRFVIVANHFKSLANIIDKLVDEGFLLSQLRVLYHPSAYCANVTYDYSDDLVSVEWILDDSSNERCIHDGDDAHTLETIVKDLMDE